MNYTSIEQSKKLLELGLSPESADMKYVPQGNYTNIKVRDFAVESNYVSPILSDEIPCWSVGALLEVMPELPKVEYDLVHRQEEYYVAFDDLNKQIHDDFLGKTPLEAAYNMVVWLLENNYIKQ